MQEEPNEQDRLDDFDRALSLPLEQRLDGVVMFLSMVEDLATGEALRWAQLASMTVFATLFELAPGEAQAAFDRYFTDCALAELDEQATTPEIEQLIVSMK